MNAQSSRKLVFIGAVIVVLLVTFGLVYKPSTSANSNPVISLQRPPFVGVASAREGLAYPLACPAGIGEKLNTEAGISAYYKSPDAITLSQVRRLFRTIETETVTYTIG
jgi:F0F1-type ATP synthase membrane subunit c/vacuolar-type H+-ATPase subunit K